MANSSSISMGATSPAQAVDQLQQQDRLRSAPLSGRVQGTDQVETRGAKRERDGDSAEKKASDRSIARADRFTNAKLARMALETAIKAVQERRTELNQHIAQTNAQTSTITQNQEAELVERSKAKASAIVASRRPHPETPEETTRKHMLAGGDPSAQSAPQLGSNDAQLFSRSQGNSRSTSTIETAASGPPTSLQKSSAEERPQRDINSEHAASSQERLQRSSEARNAQQRRLDASRDADQEHRPPAADQPAHTTQRRPPAARTPDTQTTPTAQQRSPAEAVAAAQAQEHRTESLTDTEVELAMQGTTPKFRAAPTARRAVQAREMPREDTAPPQPSSPYTIQFTATPQTIAPRSQLPSSPREFLLQFTTATAQSSSEDTVSMERSLEEQLTIDAGAIDQLQASVVESVQVTREVLRSHPSEDDPEQLQAHVTTLDQLDRALRTQHEALTAIEARYQGETRNDEVLAGRGRVTISAHQAESLASSIAKQVDAQLGQAHAPIQPMAVIQLLS
ncbi:MAG: hypothetical protein HY696_12790 [Deltaproteobacteria bacterium]|nr:hypothetical protein [Deltaproteobacteria bacterium]